MNVSVIIPVYKPDEEIMSKIENALKSQKYEGKINILKIDEGLGLADSLNFGIKRSKDPIIIILHQDCIPCTSDWIKKLVAPLKYKKAFVSISKEELPFDFWNRFDAMAKILSVKEQKELVTFERACAIKKSIFKKVGLFDSKHFRTAGEDVDMYIKLQKFGKFLYPDVKVWHYHKHSKKNRMKKELQLSNSFGALVRIYGKRFPKWYLGLIKAIPIIGWPVMLTGINPRKLGFLLSLYAVPLYSIVSLVYSYGFWKGFIAGKQTV